MHVGWALAARQQRAAFRDAFDAHGFQVAGGVVGVAGDIAVEVGALDDVAVGIVAQVAGGSGAAARIGRGGGLAL